MVFSAKTHLSFCRSALFLTTSVALPPSGFPFTRSQFLLLPNYCLFNWSVPHLSAFHLYYVFLFAYFFCDRSSLKIIIIIYIHTHTHTVPLVYLLLISCFRNLGKGEY